MVAQHRLVVEHVESLLERGVLQVGDRLPAERTLAAALGISRPSVREGIRVLEAMGIVRTEHGSGSSSGSVVAADSSAALSSTLRVHLAARTLPVPDLVRARIVLESWSVAEAARRGGSLDEAAELLRRMSSDIGRDAFYALDAEFHLALTRAAGNEVLSAVMASLRSAIQGYVTESGRGPEWSRLRRQLHNQHKGILAAISAGDGALASRRVVVHIDGFYRHALE